MYTRGSLTRINCEGATAGCNHAPRRLTSATERLRSSNSFFTGFTDYIPTMTQKKIHFLRELLHFSFVSKVTFGSGFILHSEK